MAEKQRAQRYAIFIQDKGLKMMVPLSPDLTVKDLIDETQKRADKNSWGLKITTLLLTTSQALLDESDVLDLVVAPGEELTALSTVPTGSSLQQSALPTGSAPNTPTPSPNPIPSEAPKSPAFSGSGFSFDLQSSFINLADFPSPASSPFKLPDNVFSFGSLADPPANSPTPAEPQTPASAPAPPNPEPASAPAPAPVAPRPKKVGGSPNDFEVRMILAHESTVPVTLAIPKDITMSALEAQLRIDLTVAYEYEIHLSLDSHPILIPLKGCNKPLIEFLQGTPESFNLYCSFSKTAVETGISHRFQSCSRWQPYQAPQTPKAMSCFLSSLNVFSSKITKCGDETTNSILGRIYRATLFPPLVCCLATTIEAQSLTNEEKSMISTSLFSAFRKMIPTNVAADASLFEYSNICFAYLFSPSEEDKGLISYSVAELFCSIGLGRMTTPVRLPAHNPEKIFEKVNLLAKIADSSPKGWHQYSSEQIEADPQTMSILHCTPVERAKSCYVTILKEVNQPMAFPAYLEIARGGSGKSHFSLVSPLSLNTASKPCLTLDEQKTIVVCSGHEPCSVDSLTFFDPATGKFYHKDPQKLAEKIGEYVILPVRPSYRQQTPHQFHFFLSPYFCFSSTQNAQVLDDRVITEALVVCFDRSNSMDGKSFPDMKAEPLPVRELTKDEIQQCFVELEKDERLDKLRALHQHHTNLRPSILKEIGSWFGLSGEQFLAAKKHEIGVLLAFPPQPVLCAPTYQLKEVDTKKSFQVFVKLTGGATITIDIQNDFLIFDLKVIISKKTESHHFHGLQCNAQILQDSATVESYNIQAHATLHQFGWGGRLPVDIQVHPPLPSWATPSLLTCFCLLPRLSPCFSDIRVLDQDYQ